MKTLEILIIISLIVRISIDASYSNGDDRSWHIFNNTIRTEIRKPYISPIAQKIRDSWNISSHSVYSPSYQELRIDEALDIIYHHQHPKDCSQAYFHVSEGYKTGFGSEIHVEGLGLALAMEFGRIYIPANRKRWSDKAWQTPTSLCGEDSTLTCYFEPWTSCTCQFGCYFNDFILTNNITFRIGTHTHVEQAAMFQEKIRTYRFNASDYDYFKQYKKLPPTAIESRRQERVTRTIISSEIDFSSFIPHQVEHLIDKRIPQDWKYYWWRAVSAAYLLRLNEKTKKLVERYRAPGLKELNGECVSMYIRHGDKSSEMKLQNFNVYASTAAMIWDTLNDTTPLRRNTPNKTIFFGTETPQVVADAIKWGIENKWEIIYNPIQNEIFEKKGLSIPNKSINLSNNMSFRRLQNYNKRKNVKTQGDHNKRSQKVTSTPKEEHSNFEFLSMIINLADIMRCNAYVCTLMSNYCRLVDELRVVIAAKPQAIFADLSYETCKKPPCIGPTHLINFDWR